MYQTMDEVLNSLYCRIAPKEDRQRLKNCLDQLGHPELALKTVQIAGTNGKGSTTNYVCQILKAAGYKVGMFTSPHLIVHNDRIRINDENISDEDFIMYMNKFDGIFQEYGLNMFEVDFVLAALYFRDRKVDYAIFEAGLGGRLDATNELKPLVNCITNIGMDHMAILGNTKEKIALEKAGIMKEGIPCLSGEQDLKCREVFDEEAKKVKTTIRYLEPLDVVSYPPLILNAEGLDLNLGEVAIYQRYNSATALGIIEELRKQGVKISEEAISRGFQKSWPGRFEKIEGNLYLDGAHNDEGVAALCETIKVMKQPTYILFSALSDKPATEMIRKLQAVSEEVVVTTFENKRARKREDYPSDVHYIENYRMAVEYLREKPGLRVITGSLYFVSLIKEYFK